MFEDQGLNIARQPDNGANPRPDNRSGRARGRDAGRRRGLPRRLDAERRGRPHGAALGSVEPAALPRAGQVGAAAARRRAERLAGRRARRPDGRVAASMQDIHAAPRRAPGAGALPAPARDQRAAGPARRARRHARCCCSARTTTSGLSDHPRVREAAADAAMRWGVGAGASRLVSGTMRIHRRLEERLAEFKGAETALLFGSGYLANIGVVSALAGQGRGRLLRRAEPRLDHRRLPALARARRSSTATTTPSTSPGRCERAGDRGALIVTDSVFSMDGDVAPLAELAELARRHQRAARGRRGARRRLHGPRRTRRRPRGRARARGRRRHRHARQGARRPTAPT